MIALYLLAAHLIGDFVLQTRWQAVGKFGSSTDALILRFKHSSTYTLAFVPVVALEWHGWYRAIWFLTWLLLLHYYTDSRRFTSTLGDIIAWRLGPRSTCPNGCRGELETCGGCPPKLPPANPWVPLPILLDQTLHIAQIAVLARLSIAG